MSAIRKVNGLLKSLTGKLIPSPVSVVAQRFYQVFRDHGIDTAQIPRLMSGISLDALRSVEALLPALTPDVLDKVAQLFGIRVQWLEGVDNEIYDFLVCDKRPEVILNHLAVLPRKGVGLAAEFPLRILSTTKQLDCNGSGSQLLAPVLLEKVADLGGEPIYRYYIYRDGFDWSHEPSRVELKAISRCVYKQLRTPVPLLAISERDMDDILEGRLIPHRFLMGPLLTSPSLEDYALAIEESRIGRETEELPTVIRYIEARNLQDFLSPKFDSISSVDTKETLAVPSSGTSPSAFRLSVAEEVEMEKPALSDWKDAARTIADELANKDIEYGAHDSISGIASRVADEMRKRKIYGPRGPLSEGTVKREALQGGKWTRKL